MAAVSPLLPSCNAGEFTPRLAGRTDFNKYPAGREILENLIALSEGGAMRRAGTRFAWEAKDSSKAVRLKKFEFSNEQTYPIEIGEDAIRFGRNQGQIVVDSTDAAIANGAFDSDITGWDDESTGLGAIVFSDGRLALTPGGAASDDIAWAQQDVAVSASNQGNVHVLKFRVRGLAGDTTQLRIGTTTSGAELVADLDFGPGNHCQEFTPGATTFYVQFRNRGSVRNKTLYIDDVSLISGGPVEIDSPYAETSLPAVEGPQSTDAQFLFHNDHAPRVLTRRGHLSWSVSLLDFQDGPWDAQNATATTLTPSATIGAGITITASAVTGINGGRGFLATDVGRLIRIDNPASGTNWGWAKIAGVTSTTVVVADVRRAFGATSADVNWRLGSWSETTGYPGNGTFVEQRLGACRTYDRPQTFWLSETNGFSASHVSMSPDSPDATNGTWDGEVQDDDALDWTISSDQVESILWMSAGQSLILGTSGGEWVATSGGPVLTPTDVEVTRHTKHGSAPVQPVRVDHVVLFLQRARRKIRELAFSFEVDGFRAPDMTRLAQHIAFGGVREMAFQQEPDNLVWAARADGQLLCMTYRRDEDVVGWSRHILGGSFASGSAVVESVMVMPGADGEGQVQSSEDRDEVWLVVKRTINGQTRRYIEVMERDFEDGHEQEDAYYLDSIITYDGAPATVISGLTHLEGQTVGIWADGAILPDRVVSGGAIELDAPASVVQVGLRYRHRGKTLKLDAGAVTGTAVGKQKRIKTLTAVLHNSHTAAFGPAFDKLEAFDFRQVGDGPVVPLFTGEVTKSFDGDWERDARICFESDDPAPFMLLALGPEMKTNEKA